MQIIRKKELKTFLCDDKKQPVVYVQDLDLFLKNTYQQHPHGCLIGYNFNSGVAIYLNKVDFTTVMSENIQRNLEYLNSLALQGKDRPGSVAENVILDNDTFKEMQYPYTLQWNYKNKAFTLEIEADLWITFSLDASKIEIKNSLSNWISITVKN